MALTPTPTPFATPHGRASAALRRAPLAKPIAIALLAIACMVAQGQEAKVSKEREALRRAQAALRAAQEQQSALQADKAKVEAQVAVALKDVAGARAQAAGGAAKVRQREAELKALRTHLEAAQAAQQQGETQAAAREQALQQQLLALRQESAARQQANQALVQILERSTTALADAEAKNRKLHALGQDLVQRYIGRSAVDIALQQDPLLGLATVRFEDEAEKLRAALRALQVR